MAESVDKQDITAVILAGGAGSRMGGVDKGLQEFRGAPLALHALMRVQPQVGDVMLNANRNFGVYEGFGVPVWPDDMPDRPGPLAGFLTGLAHCETPYLLTVPCDTPRFPLDLAARLGAALIKEDADIAMASGLEDGQLRSQPVFCLLKAELLTSLRLFLTNGGRKIDAWTAQHKTVLVPFDAPGDDPLAFANANTLDELRSLENS